MRPGLLQRRLVHLLMVLLLLPGWYEVAESVEHLLHDGHLPHSEQHDRVASEESHPEADREHGCTALSHHCGCHASVPGVLDPPPPEFARGFSLCENPAPSTASHPPTRATPPPTRPPIA